MVTAQVVLDCEATCGPSFCGIYFNTNHTNLTNCAGVNLQLGNKSIRVSLTRIFRILLIARGNDLSWYHFGVLVIKQKPKKKPCT